MVEESKPHEEKDESNSRKDVMKDESDGALDDEWRELMGKDLLMKVCHKVGRALTNFYLTHMVN